MIRNLLARYRGRTSDNILRHGAVYFLFFGLTTVGNVVFRKYASINLTIEDFGIFTALLAFYSIIAQPFGVLQMIITKRMALFHGRGEDRAAFGFFRGILKIFVVLSLVSAIGILLVAPILQGHYHLPTIFSVLLVIGIFFMANLASCYTGCLQAYQRFAMIGTLNTTVTLVKLGATFVLLWFFFGSLHPAPLVLPDSFLQMTRIPVGPIYRFDIPLLGVAASMTVLLVASGWLVSRIRRDTLAGQTHPVADKIAAGPMLREFLPIFVLYIGFSLLKNLDEYIARHFLTEFDNGLYGAIATVGKSSIFLVSTISFITFPKFAAVADDVVASKRIMLKGLVLGTAGILAAFAAILAFPELMLKILTHAKYLAAADDLKWFFLAFIPYPITFIFINYFIVHHDWKYVAGIIVGAGALVSGYQLFHGSIHDILSVLGVCGYAILAGSALYWLRKIRAQANPA